MIKTGIIGATGYVGIELLRLLRIHSEVEIKVLFSRSSAGKRITDIYPQFTCNQIYTLEEYNTELIKECDIVFAALPHGVSQKVVADIYQSGTKIIDMSGDFRYSNIDIYEEWYGVKHEHPGLAKKAVYGLTELNREQIKKAEIIANPGCYPTASLLGMLPLIENNLINPEKIIIDAKSGVSGAGKSIKESLIFNEVDENIKAYSINSHRHTSEIENIINIIGNEKNNIMVSFTPHLIPMKRGILSTIYLELNRNKIDRLNIKESNIQEFLTKKYKNYYSNSDFVQLLLKGLPETKYVNGTNFCHLAVNYDIRTERLIIISAIDNMGKGAAGQAIQNMNILYNLPEKTGLEQTALIP